MRNESYTVKHLSSSNKHKYPQVTTAASSTYLRQCTVLWSVKKLCHGWSQHLYTWAGPLPPRIKEETDIRLQPLIIPLCFSILSHSAQGWVFVGFHPLHVYIKCTYPWGERIFWGVIFLSNGESPVMWMWYTGVQRHILSTHIGVLFRVSPC